MFAFKNTATFTLKINLLFFNSKFSGKVWSCASAGHLAIKAPMPRYMHGAPKQHFSRPEIKEIGSVKWKESRGLSTNAVLMLLLFNVKII